METNSDILLPQISVEDFSKYIISQVNKLSELGNKIEFSDKSAKEAMEYVKKMVLYKNERWLIFGSDNTETVFESVQAAVNNIAKTQMFSVEALKKVFEFQQAVTDTTKELFRLCCGNRAMNNIALDVITKQLDNASKEELPELARKELIKVVMQLKAQEDEFRSRERLEKITKENTRRLDKKDEIDKEQTQRLQKIDVVLEKKDRIDKMQEKKILENKSEIDKIKQLYNQQSIQINKIEESIMSSNKHMKETDELYEIQLKEIKTLEKKINKILIVVIILFIALISISLLMLYYK